MFVLGIVLASLVGISLGLIGSGGSILTVPILVYVMGVSPVLATAYSLFIVGSTALVGGFQNIYQKKVDFKTAIIFGIPSIAAVYATRLWLMPIIPKTLIHIAALVLLARLPMQLAVGTSLFIIAAKSLFGFMGDLQGDQIMDWHLLLTFTAASVVGIFVGNYLSRFFSGAKLKTTFGWFVLIMGIYIIVKELFL